LDHRQNELDIDVAKDVNNIENALKIFWDKAHAFSDLLSRYRQEQELLLQKQAEHEKELASLRTEMLVKNQELKRIQAEHSRLIHSDSGNVLNSDEKENLKNRIHDLLIKINSHL